MKATVVMKLFGIAFLTVLVTASIAQEYDDMYFTPSDRKANKEKSDVMAKNTGKTEDQIVKNEEDYGDVTENYSSKNINPEYIARYKNSKEPAGEEGSGYYEENFDNSESIPEETSQNSQNNYSYPSTFYRGMDPWFRMNMYNNIFYDPFYGWNSSPGWNIGFGYTFGYSPSWNIGFSYGTGYGYYPYYGGWYDPFWGFDPWYSPYSYYSYNPWCYSCGFMSPYRYGYSSYHYTGYYGGWYGGDSYKYDSKKVIYGRRPTRGTHLADKERINEGRERRTATPVTNSEPEQNTRISDSRSRVSTGSERDYSRSQNEYYTRTRSETGRASGSTDNSNSPSSSTQVNRYTNESGSRSAGSSSDYTRPTYRTSRESSSGGSHTYYNGASRSSGSYGNNSRSGSYSSGSRSSGGSSYSSGSSGSRSSSSYSSGSSGGGSRSSSSSSGGSRSSGGSSGSSSRSGRGN